MKKGFKAQSKWTSDFKEFECLANDRWMDRTLKEAHNKEKYEVDHNSMYFVSYQVLYSL